MRTKLLSMLVLMAALVVSGPAFAEKLQDDANQLFKPIPYAPPALKDNPMTLDKVELGKMLFFEPRLSKSSLLSCNTCHNLSFGGDDYQETSIGHGWQKGPRNAPTVLNSVFNLAQFWDGRAADLKEQAKGPVQASVEMNSTPDRVVVVLKSMPEYTALFKKAFPGDKDPISFDNMAKAIEAFEATLLTPDSRFDLYLKGDMNALSKDEKKGLELFINKGCADCHAGVNMGGEDYYTFGVVERPDAKIVSGDKGRFAVTNTAADEYVFKSPSLRNIEYTAPYFHSGKVWGLQEAVAVMSSAQLGISLTDSDTKFITAFLKTLTGVQPKVAYPVLPPSTDATPQPEWK
ncbi:cytochrome-c peroxidase [Geovibrio thiophilus]|uniref:Cytochrome-c peroxidase n=1 Tax=Geovibrio thiophilus TaxID=139438 RepID=A0A410K058_9BACT|nr:cytochrome-c peroxidase [Geovibrio thiophilus]QAR33826.1 cytochrome-c peroxidase [Geovibrio thiophilus]